MLLSFLLPFLAIMLWCYESLDDRIRIRKEAKKLKGWVEAGKGYGTVISYLCCPPHHM